jgi:hypothetical protein
MCKYVAAKQTSALPEQREHVTPIRPKVLIGEAHFWIPWQAKTNTPLIMVHGGGTYKAARQLFEMAAASVGTRGGRVKPFSVRQPRPDFFGRSFSSCPCQCLAGLGILVVRLLDGFGIVIHPIYLFLTLVFLFHKNHVLCRTMPRSTSRTFGGRVQSIDAVIFVMDWEHVPLPNQRHSLPFSTLYRLIFFLIVPTLLCFLFGIVRSVLDIVNDFYGIAETDTLSTSLLRIHRAYG